MRGQALIENAFFLALIALVILSSLQSLGIGISDRLNPLAVALGGGSTVSPTPPGVLPTIVTATAYWPTPVPTVGRPTLTPTPRWVPTLPPIEIPPTPTSATE